MADVIYPKIKYQGVEVKSGQHHTENPGYIYQKVASAEEESALAGDWYDTPAEAIKAYGKAKHDANPPAAASANQPQTHGQHEPARRIEEFPIESETRKRGR